MIRSPNGRLIIWNDGQDAFTYLDLKYNFEWLDRIIGNDGFEGGGSGSAGATVSRRQDLTGVASAWLGEGESSRVYFKASDIDNPDPVKAARAPARNLFRIIYALAANQTPLGHVLYWYRHSDSIQPPAGYVICNGQTLSADQHSFGDFTYQVPDLRNKVIVGADVTKARTVAGTAADNLNYADGNSTGSLATNAPGVGYDSIRNTTPTTRKAKMAFRRLMHTHIAGSLSTVAHVHGMVHNHSNPQHSHLIPAHAHTINHVHVVPDHVHIVEGNTGDASGNLHYPVQANPSGVAPNYEASGFNHYHFVRVATSGVAGAVFGFTSVYGAPYFTKGYPHPAFTSIQIDHTNVTQNQVQSGTQDPFNTYPGGGENTGPPVGTVSTGATTAQVSGTTGNPGWGMPLDVDVSDNLDTRPAYVGLLPIMKVKKYFNIIDGDRGLFDSE